MPEPAYPALERAYAGLKTRNYDQAIADFRKAIAAEPNRAAVRKDLAYTLLKIGENEAARAQFAEAMRLDPADLHVAMEYAFLSFEAKHQAEARRIFDRIRKTGDVTAEQAFQNIDQPLAEGIARWRKAVELSPDNFSAHFELATLAEQRDELQLAAENFEKAFQLRPEERSLLLDLARVWKGLGRKEESSAALLAASRGAQPRVTEKAHELMSRRYPYVYEFRAAVTLDAKNLELRRELAYLLLQMDKRDEAEREFQTIHEQAPADLLTAAQLGFLKLNRKDTAGAQPLLDQVIKGDNPELAERARAALKLPQALHPAQEAPHSTSTVPAKILAEKSLKAGYLNDAVKYLHIAHESEPEDAWVMLKLGWAYNLLHQDSEAFRWFDQARKSGDPAIAGEAAVAYESLRPAEERLRTTAWIFPFFSSRWKDAFGYGQVKTELKLGKLPVRPYLSTRFIGDVRNSAGSNAASISPQYLSETSLIFAVGIASKPWHGATGWFEAGEAVKYLANRTDVGAAIPDYRGGISYSKGFGHLLNGGRGWFSESTVDGVFVSRFQNDMLAYSQNRTGYTLPRLEAAGGLQSQAYWNYNLTADKGHQYWANFAEMGPGVRFRFQGLPKSLVFSVNALRGVYLINEGNPRRPNYFDFRAGFWYAFTH